MSFIAFFPSSVGSSLVASIAFGCQVPIIAFILEHFPNLSLIFMILKF